MQNVNLASTTASVPTLYGADPKTAAATWPVSFLVLDNVVSTGGPGITLARWSAEYVYDALINDGSGNSYILTPYSAGAGAVVMGTNAICGGYGNATYSRDPFVALGNFGWNCSPTAPAAANLIPGGTLYAWSLAPMTAYDKFMGLSATSAGNMPDLFPAAIPSRNGAQEEVVIEQTNVGGSSNPYRASASNNMMSASNIVLDHISFPGARANIEYNDGGTIFSYVGASGGSLLTGRYNI